MESYKEAKYTPLNQDDNVEKEEFDSDEELVDLPGTSPTLSDKTFSDYFLQRILNCHTLEQLNDLTDENDKLIFILNQIHDLPQFDNNKSQAFVALISDSSYLIFLMISMLAALTNNDNGEPLVGNELPLNILTACLSVLAGIFSVINFYTTYKILKAEAKETKQLLRLANLKNQAADEINDRLKGNYFIEILPTLKLEVTVENILQCYSTQKNEIEDYFKKLSQEDLTPLLHLIDELTIRDKTFSFNESDKNKYTRLKDSLTAAANVSLTLLSFIYSGNAILEDFKLDTILRILKYSTTLSIAIPAFLLIGAFFGYKTNTALLDAEKIKQFREFLDREWMRKIDIMTEKCETYEKENRANPKLKKDDTTLYRKANNTLLLSKILSRQKHAALPKQNNLKKIEKH